MMIIEKINKNIVRFRAMSRGDSSVMNFFDTTETVENKKDE